MSNESEIEDAVQYTCPECGSGKFEFHMIDNKHFVMKCAGGLKGMFERVTNVELAYPCGWQSTLPPTTRHIC